VSGEGKNGEQKIKPPHQKEFFLKTKPIALSIDE